MSDYDKLPSPPEGYYWVVEPHNLYSWVLMKKRKFWFPKRIEGFSALFITRPEEIEWHANRIIHTALAEEERKSNGPR